VKAEGITSARGPMLAVSGLKGLDSDPSRACDLWVAGEDLRRTFDWRTTSMLFAVPEACEGVQVLVTRLRAKRLDKFIGGKLWVDDVRLEKVASSAPPASSEASQQRELGGSMDAVIGAITAPASPSQPEVETLPR